MPATSAAAVAVVASTAAIAATNNNPRPRMTEEQWREAHCQDLTVEQCDQLRADHQQTEAAVVIGLFGVLILIAVWMVFSTWSLDR